MEPSGISPSGTPDNLLKNTRDARGFWNQNPLSSIWQLRGGACSSSKPQGVENYNLGRDHGREGNNELGADNDSVYHLAREQLAEHMRRDPFVSPGARTARRGPTCNETQIPKGEGGEPEFAFPIGNLTTPVGREAVLSCTVNNLGKYRVGWLKAEDQTILSLHTRVVTHNSRISVTHDNQRTWRLHIRQLKVSDRGCYMCQINTNIMKKQVGCIDVHVPPDILNDDTSADVSMQEGENATLVCKAAGHPDPRITWKREDGSPILIKKGVRGEMFAAVDTYNGSSLHFWRLDRRQMGAFLCIASNDVPPAVSKRIILNVNFAPSIRVPNQLLGAPLGTDVPLVCYVEAFPNTINYWVKNGGEMLLDGSKYSVRESRSGYKVLMTLKIRSFGLSDVGTYNCVSTNSLGKAEGTLRLYEIKLSHPHDPAEDNQAAYLGELAETSRGPNQLTKREKGGSSTVTACAPLLLAASLVWWTSS